MISCFFVSTQSCLLFSQELNQSRRFSRCVTAHLLVQTHCKWDLNSQSAYSLTLFFFLALSLSLCLSVIQILWELYLFFYLSDIISSLQAILEFLLTRDEMSQTTSMRIILRYRERFFQKSTAIINAFFTWRDIQSLEDYCTHICSNSSSSQLYLVLDLYCKTHSNVDLNKLDLEVFQVSEIDSLCVISSMI